MPNSSKKVKRSSQNNPLDSFYYVMCHACTLNIDECLPGSDRERNCILASLTAAVKVIGRDMVKDR